ncbi:hypothetical protein Tco_0926866 [Tanacetum coccineum]|uniref:Retrovirus-related Pol polyprotein from transposon TNT 1-94 n=1 Tax=Tanacetum coccineum TaxID=301880 RepID=A0ABQ5DBU0_9ASTR
MNITLLDKVRYLLYQFMWKAIMKEEMDSLRKNKTWELVDHPTGQNLVSCKCLFKINEGIEGAQNPRRYMMIACKRKAEIGSTKHLQKKEFDMKKLKEAKNILEYAKDPDKGRSITCYTFVIYGCVVSCKATLQHAVALSTKEAEYMAFSEVVKKAIWLRGLLKELGVELNTHNKMRLKAKTVEVLKVGTKQNDADALTNVVAGL